MTRVRRAKVRYLRCGICKSPALTIALNPPDVFGIGCLWCGARLAFLSIFNPEEFEKGEWCERPPKPKRPRSAP